MNDQKILAALNSINTWWNGGDVPNRIKKAETKRKAFYNIANQAMSEDRIIFLSGPRQVGKTTLMGQLIEDQIKKRKIEPRRIIYIPIDNQILQLNSDNVLIDSIDVYLEFIIREPIEKLSDKIYIYLDEVQALENWGKQLKTYYDSYDMIKFVISGSSQTKLHTDAAESLVGRIDYRVLRPFKFREFLEFHMPKRSKELESSTGELRNVLKNSIEDGKLVELYNHVTRLKLELSDELPEIKQILDRYIIKGGYPGLLKYEGDYDRAFEQLKTDLELTVFKDIYRMFNTRNSSDIMSLLVLLANSSGQKVNYSSLANSIGIDRRAVANYISYYKLLYLVSESPFYVVNKRKKVEKMSKIYMVDSGHRNVLVGKMNEGMLKESDAGLVIQSIVFNHAQNLKYRLSKYADFEVCYWEDYGLEVDVVIDLPFLLLPCEVKSKSGDKGKKAIYKFLEVHKESKWGMVITKDELKLEDRILFLPLWAFLLMC